MACATKCGPLNGARHKMIAVWTRTGLVQVQHFSPLANKHLRLPTVTALASRWTKWKTISASRQAWRISTCDNLSLPASADVEKRPSTTTEGLLNQVFLYDGTAPPFFSIIVPDTFSSFRDICPIQVPAVWEPNRRSAPIRPAKPASKHWVDRLYVQR